MDRWSPLKNLKSFSPIAKWMGYGLVVALGFGFLMGALLDAIQSEGAYHAPPPLKGMALGLFSEEPDYDYTQDLQEIKALGANTVLLLIPWYQKDIRANDMEPRYGWGKDHITYPDDRLKSLIKKSHQMGMQVLLMPYLRFDHRGEKEWRGVLKPNNLQEWQKNYTHFIFHYADLAQETDVEYFSIGSELGNMETQTKFWKGLIQKIRNRYTGKLLYSANWDHYSIPTFWEDLDIIGITSYHRLTESNYPSLSKLKQAWGEVKGEMLNFMSKYPDKKIIITEVGYPSLRGASRDPWNYFAKMPVDLQEQAICYRSFIETWNDTPQLKGVFWWVWFGPGGPQDRSYTPKGKPAARYLKRWYLGNSS